MKKIKIKNKKGFTLIDVLIGTFLVLIVFSGIFSVFQFGLKVTGQSKNRIVATAIVNGEIEKVRNLPYASVGIQGGFPSGLLLATETVSRNETQYTIDRRVDYVVDPADGIAFPDDDCPNDYKRAEIKVSWQGRFGGEVKIYTDAAPKNLAQECSDQGGILSVSVFDAYGVMVSAPFIEVKDPGTGEVIKVATPSEGKHYFSLPPETYRAAVSKSGYNSERSYGTSEITTPGKPDPIVLEGRLTEISFSIDKVSSFSIDTLSPWGEDSFSDSFIDGTKISEFSNVNIENGEIKLVKTGELYVPEGYVISQTIVPGDISSWQELNYSEYIVPETTIRYQVLYLQGENWVLIPDGDLLGNSSGLSPPPIELDTMAVASYPLIRIKVTLLSLGSQEYTPILYDWQVFWRTNVPTAIPNAAFHLEGEKIIGHDAQEDPVPEYSEDLSSNASGHKDIPNLEWDNYIFSVPPGTGLDLIAINPETQPVSLLPDSAVPVRLYLDAENSLLITIKDAETLFPIFAGRVRLYNSGLGYDVTLDTNEKGQVYFIPLESATYNLEAEAPGYSGTSDTAQVSGDDTKTITLIQIE